MNKKETEIFPPGRRDDRSWSEGWRRKQTLPQVTGWLMYLRRCSDTPGAFPAPGEENTQEEVRPRYQMRNGELVSVMVFIGDV